MDSTKDPLTASTVSPEVLNMLDVHAVDLLRSIAEGQDPYYGFGNMSCSVYDTAWVSMVRSPNKDTSSEWLFPQSFGYVLDTQLSSGGWDSDSLEMADSILSTMAGLLTLQKHSRTNPSSEEMSKHLDFNIRINNAVSFLQTKLKLWAIETTKNVGFELLIPAHLELLEKEGHFFDFPGRATLLKIREKKMSLFRPEMLYGENKMSALHSLESLIGLVEFDRVSHHKVFGSMMASPSSTAAYLIYSSKWDWEAEAYLRHVISHGPGKGNGSVGSAFPSSLFETSWIITTFAAGGFDVSSFDRRSLESFKLLMRRAFDDGMGVIGFAPGVGADADDTAKGLKALEALDVSISSERMIHEYEQPECFKTYSSERDPSFTTNCNVLVAILRTREATKYEPQIQKIVRFVCQQWHLSVKPLIDKWNLSPYYPLMLMSQALMGALIYWQDVQYPSLGTDLEDEMIQTLWQALTRTLQSQNEDGSWGKPPTTEGTAYALLAINILAALPTIAPIESHTRSAINLGREFLAAKLIGEQLEPARLWVEKVTFGSVALSKAFVLAALKARPNTQPIQRLRELEVSVITQPTTTKLYTKMATLATIPSWLVLSWQVEARLYTSKCKDVAVPLFPGLSQRGQKYIDLIPFTWVVGNNLQQPPPLSSGAMFAMMVLSLLIYQVDEFMEGIVAPQYFERQRNEIKCAINNIFAALENKPISLSQVHSGGNRYRNMESDAKNLQQLSPPPSAGLKDSVNDIGEILNRFVKYVLNHPLIQSASRTTKLQLRINLHTFLLAHLTQIDDNHHLQRQNTSPSQSSQSLYTWVRSTSANHTGGPFAFYFLLALLSPSQKTYQWPSPSSLAVYVAEDVNRRSATLCRIYNDIGSMARDREEENLNSGDFLDASSQRKATNDGKWKEELLTLASYERFCLDGALEKLKMVCKGERRGEEEGAIGLWRAIKAFVEVTDLYGQMYLVKDLTPRIQMAGRKRKMEDDDKEEMA